MAMLQITTGPTGLHLQNNQSDLWDTIRDTLTAHAGPVTVLIHGYRYEPGHPVHCPHDSLNSPAPKHPKNFSLPSNLGLACDDGHEIGISFGWSARGTIWQAYRKAGLAGSDLAQLVDRIKSIDPKRNIRILAHSLGARVALRAMSESAPCIINRVILMAAAEFRTDALEALRSPGGYHCEVLHATSRENDIFDFVLERLISGSRQGDKMLGHRLLHAPNLACLQLDHPEGLMALSMHGYKIANPEHTICHWSPYRRKGVFRLYRDFLDGQLSVRDLNDILPLGLEPRWTRLGRKIQPKAQVPGFFAAR